MNYVTGIVQIRQCLGQLEKKEARVEGHGVCPENSYLPAGLPLTWRKPYFSSMSKKVYSLAWAGRWGKVFAAA